MKKFFAVIVVSLCLVSPACAQVQQDTELHRVIGGLYTLAVAVDLSGSLNPDIGQLSKYFAEIPSVWSNSISTRNNTVWVGVPVDKFSSARKYLREHAQELGIMDSPDGYAWLSGSYAWLKAGYVSGGKFIPANIRASRGSGSDEGVIFFSAQGASDWWQAFPTFEPNFAKIVIERFGVNDAPELHRPEGVNTSLYDSVKPSSVGLPGKIHYGTSKSSFDMSIEMGDVLLTPVPRITR